MPSRAHLRIGSWEFATSLDFDWDFITGKKKFHWPMVTFPSFTMQAWNVCGELTVPYQIFYFLDRYLLFFAMIGMYVR